MTGRPTVRDAQPDTATRILDVAERLVQTSGFNGFSYADISAELGITKASLHHHFATKAELGRALIERYSEAFNAALKVVDQRGGDAAAKLERYVKLYAECPGGSDAGCASVQRRCSLCIRSATSAYRFGGEVD